MDRKTSTSRPITTLCTIVCLFLGQVLSDGHNLKQISHAEGLTNNAVLDIFPTGDGLLWVGTCEGLSLYYNSEIHPVLFSEEKSLDGFLIEQIVNTGDEYWVRTSYGLFHWNIHVGQLHGFSQFSGNSRITTGREGTLLLYDTPGEYMFYDTNTRQFFPVELSSPNVRQPVAFGLSEHYLWIVGAEGIYRYPYFPEAEGPSRTGPAECLSTVPITSCVQDDSDYYLTDKSGQLYHYDFENGRGSLILSLSEDISRRGSVTGVVHWRNQLFISFSNDGVIRCVRDADGAWVYEDLELHIGIFRLRKDPSGSHLWIATDGQGIYKYWDSEYSVRSTLSNDIDQSLGQPLRAFHRDTKGALWIGTKGSGLIRIPATTDSKGRRPDIYLSENSELAGNSVYAFASSRFNGFWIGTEDGLNYFDERNGALKRVSCPEELKYVHAIREVGDTLYIATVGRGIFKAELHQKSGKPELSDIRQYRLNNGLSSSNYFFALYQDSAGKMWFCNRGQGLFYMENDALHPFPLTSSQKYPSVNDVFCMTEADGSLWIGTGNGLISIDKEGKERRYSSAEGLPNNTIHSLGKDNQGGIWISTNAGLVRLSTKTMQFEQYGQNKGIPVIEYSDGAVLEETDRLCFGGVNGWVEIRKNEHYYFQEAPSGTLNFITLTLGEKTVDLYTLFNRNHRFDPRIELSEKDRTLSIEFFLNDAINEDDYIFFYRMDSHSDTDWIPLGKSRHVSLTQLAAGSHTLAVMSRNLVSGQEIISPEVAIRRKPSWSESFGFRMLVILLLVSVILNFIRQLIRKIRLNQESELNRIRQRQKESLYEEKLAFFTNVTHEFKTPLSLIYVPCEQLLSYENADEFIRRQAARIRDNAVRLNNLIQEIIDFRQLETQHEHTDLKNVAISSLCDEVCDYFSDLALRNKLTLEKNIQPDIHWVTDSRHFSRILTNLITNALKYTQEGGTVRVGLDTADTLLRLKVYNTGKGIAPEDREQIFNRYQILRDVEESRIGSLTSRNGLGLNICKKTAELLNAGIEVESIVGEYAEFIVLFPNLSPDQASFPEEKESAKNLSNLLPDLSDRLPVVADREEVHHKRPRILAVDDRPEMLQLLVDVLDEYDVSTALDADSAWQTIRNDPPELIISDIMMPGTSGLDLIRKVKQNKHTMQIPVIILSAKNTVEERVEGIDSGADVYLGKPFSIKELKSTITRLKSKADQMKEYYDTAASAFSYTNGALLAVEDKAFISEVNDYLRNAIPEGEITVESMAEALHLSTRNLYRKFKALGLLPPNEYIREQKLIHAARMLRTSNLTISEIIYDSGFNNRAHFYKEFNKRFGMTPKDYRAQNRTKDESPS